MAHMPRLLNLYPVSRIALYNDQVLNKATYLITRSCLLSKQEQDMLATTAGDIQTDTQKQKHGPWDDSVFQFAMNRKKTLGFHKFFTLL